MRRDLNYFSKYHIAPAKTSPFRLALISGVTVIMAGMIGALLYFAVANAGYQSQIDQADQTLKSPELTEELNKVTETENNISKVKNDQTLFSNLEGDFRRIHRVNEAFLNFLNGRVTRDLVFDSIKINYDDVEITGSAKEQPSIAKFEEELRKTDKFNNIFISNITYENEVYKFNIKILTKDVDFNEKQK